MQSTASYRQFEYAADRRELRELELHNRAMIEQIERTEREMELADTLDRDP